MCLWLEYCFIKCCFHTDGRLVVVLIFTIKQDPRQTCSDIFILPNENVDYNPVEIQISLNMFGCRSNMNTEELKGQNVH